MSVNTASTSRRTSTRTDTLTAKARPRLTGTVLAVFDLAALFIAALIAVPMTGGVASPLALVWQASLVLLLAPFAFGLAGLYPGAGMTAITEFRRLARGIVGVTVVGLVVLPYVPGAGGPWPLLLAAPIAIFTVPVARAIARELFARQAWWGVPVVVIGAGATARLLIERFRQYPRTGLRPVALFDDDPTKAGTWVEGVYVVGELAASQTFSRKGIQTAVIAMPGVRPDDLVDLVRRHTHSFQTIVVVPNLFGMKSLGVETCDLGGVVGLRVQHNLINPLNRFAKRALDLLLAVPAVVIGLPLVAVSVAAIVLVSPGNPLYYQVRIGMGGRKIRVWKLRTMYHDAAERLDAHLDHDPVAKREWAQSFKLTRDPRILPIVGAFLRKSSLDELPQIFNVLRGEMSLVGPRPFPEYHLDVFTEAFRELRTTVRPGITGLWQVSVRSDGDVDVQRDIDTYYIRNWSIWMDLYVLARTPLVVLTPEARAEPGEDLVSPRPLV